MSRFGAPGVYYQSVDAGAPPVTPFRTDIAGFVGIAERGPVNCPVPIGSWRQFTTWFGTFTGAGYLAYAVRAYFENGGRRCWVVRVASQLPEVGATASTVTLSSPAGPVWRIAASSEGTWGNSLAVTMREHNPAQTTTTATAIDGTWSEVGDVSGLRRATHVRVSQAGGAQMWKVVSTVDPHLRRVFWVHPDDRRKLPNYDSPLTGFDPNLPVLVESIEYSILVTESGRVVRFYDGLTMIPEHDGYGPRRLMLRTWTEDPASGAAQPVPAEPIIVDDVRHDPTDVTGISIDPFATLPCTGGRDGLIALAVDDFIGQPIEPDDDLAALALKLRGLRALEDISEIGLLAVPDAQVRPVSVNPTAAPEPCVPDPCVWNPPPDPVSPPRDPGEQPPTFGMAELFRIQSEMILQCERKRDRFALLDPPIDAVESTLGGIRPIQEWRSRFDTQFAAIYFPWIRVLDPLAPTSGAVRAIPPSGHVAGVVAATDLDSGVHHAPANRRVEWALDTTIPVDDERHAILNSLGVNAVRTTVGRGLRVQGARTVSSDPDWRFVNVRRFVSMVEKALETGLQWAVFEPNGALLRARATMAVTIFLLGVHEAGMLAGATPDESFYVQCDLDNNPDTERELGRLLIEIGIAPTKPFEFIVLRVGRVRDSIEVSDTAGVFGAATVGA